MVKDTEPWTIFYAVQTVNLLAACQQKWFLPSEIACWQWPVGPSPPLSVFQTAISPSSLGYREFLACIVNLRRINCCDSVGSWAGIDEGVYWIWLQLGTYPTMRRRSSSCRYARKSDPLSPSGLVEPCKPYWVLCMCVCVCHVVG
jgi:hypothetical protein